MKNVLLASVSVWSMSCAVAVQLLPTNAAAAPVGGDAAPAAAPAHSAAQADQAVLGEVIVTASRRAENVQRSALAIQALTAETLQRANVSKPEDLSALAPGLQIGTGGAHPQAYIRGVGNFSTQTNAESAVAFNLDGVYISRPWATRGMFYDLDRVEVLKGPQGTLYGRNASGGAINVISAKPELGRMGGFAEVQLGNYDLVQGTAAVNLPVSSTVAIRLAGQIVDRNGYLSDGYDDDKHQSGRFQLLWKPNDDVSLLLNANYQHSGGKGGGTTVSPQLPGDKFRGASDPAVTAIFLAEPGIGPLLTYPKADGFLDDTVKAVGAELNWNLGFATLTLLPAYRDSKLRDLTYLPGFPVYNNEHDKQTSVELRLGNSTEKLKWVVGGYFFNENQTNLDGDPTLVVLQGVSAEVSQRLDSQVRSYAVFGQGTYSLTDRFRVTGGLRYTYERKRQDEDLKSYGFPNAPPPTLCAAPEVFDPATVEVPLFCRLDIPIQEVLTYNSITYKAGVEYDLAPQSMAYANVSTGFKSGGFYLAPPPGNTFDPEKLTAFEAGVKNRFLGNRLQVNLEAFYWKYKDHQESVVGPTSIPGFFTFTTINAGKAKTYGADLDVVFRATPDDEFSLKVQYNGSNYDVFKYNWLTAVFGPPVTGCAVGPMQTVNGLAGIQVVDCSGKSLVRAPKWTGTAGYSHTFDLGEAGELTASFDVQFASAYWLSIDFLQSGRQEAYATENFDLTYTPTGRNWVLSAFVHNIGNEVVRTQAFRDPFISPANPLASPDGLFLPTVRAPRTFGAKLRLNF